MNARLSLMLLGLSALGACAHAAPDGPPVATAADRHAINVTQSDLRIDVAVTPGAVTLDAKNRDGINGFAHNYLRTGHGSLIMSTPSGSNNAEAASMLAQQTRLALVDDGVQYAAIAGSTYDASGVENPPIILTFTRFEAEAPHCAPLWEQDLAHQSDNQPWESFGCATQANLAAMVEDPHDLLEPRDQDPRDSGRRAVVMDAYRRGAVTHATRDSDEHVGVSSVAQ